MAAQANTVAKVRRVKRCCGVAAGSSTLTPSGIHQHLPMLPAVWAAVPQWKTEPGEAHAATQQTCLDGPPQCRHRAIVPASWASSQPHKERCALVPAAPNSREIARLDELGGEAKTSERSSPRLSGFKELAHSQLPRIAAEHLSCKARLPVLEPHMRSREGDPSSHGAHSSFPKHLQTSGGMMTPRQLQSRSQGNLNPPR